MNISQIEKIRLSGVLPLAFNSDADRRMFAASQLMLCEAEFCRGGVYCINASSGTGKTSLCNFIYGVRVDYEGEILFDDIDIRKFSIEDWCAVRRTCIAYLPQELELFDELSAFDNVMLKNRLTDYKSESEIRAMFERLEIDNRMHNIAGRMSVGQKQRVALIRALCQPFSFMILDEPVSHLDSRSNRLCADIIMEQARKQCAGVIFTSVGNPLDVACEFKSLNL